MPAAGDPGLNTAKLHQERDIFAYVLTAGGLTALAKVIVAAKDPGHKSLVATLTIPQVLLGSFVAMVILEGVSTIGGSPGTSFARGLALVALISSVLINGDAVFGATTTALKPKGTGTLLSSAHQGASGPVARTSPTGH